VKRLFPSLSRKGPLNFWARYPARGVPPAKMTLHELATWARSARDLREYHFRLGYARKVLREREGIPLFTSCLMLCKEGACFER